MISRRSLIKNGLAFGIASAMPHFSLLSDQSVSANNGFQLMGQNYTRRVASSSAPNMLMFSIDDLNDWVGFLGPTDSTIGRIAAYTPNFDAFAKQALSFDRAFCSVPQCLSSRFNITTARSPLNTGLVGKLSQYKNAECRDGDSPYDVCRNEIGEEEFANFYDVFYLNGYDTVTTGKIYHGPMPDRSIVETGPYYGYGQNNVPLSNMEHERDFDQVGERILWSRPKAPTIQSDREVSDWAVKWIRSRNSATPFFLTCGIYMPHLPWRPPSWCWKRNEVPFDPMSYRDALADLEDLPNIVTDPLAYAEAGKGQGRTLINQQYAEEFNERGWVIKEQAIHAYMASVTWADYNFGRVMNELADSPYAEDTIVSLWSDHGFHLGEKAHWQKSTLWERSNRIPMLVSVPGDSDFNGSVYTNPVSAQDLAPTLYQLADLNMPTGPAFDLDSDQVFDGTSRLSGFDGRSLVWRVRNGKRNTRRATLTAWEWDNYAVRLGKYCLIRYKDGSREFYNLKADPAELINLAHPSNANKRCNNYQSKNDQLERFMPPIGWRSPRFT